MFRLIHTYDGGEEFRSRAACCHEGRSCNVFAQMKTLLKSRKSNDMTNPYLEVFDMARRRPAVFSHLAYLLERRDEVVVTNQSQSIEHVDRLQGNNTPAESKLTQLT